jgi:thioredoxin reductase (NADPH)
VAVVGGGNSAGQATVFLARHASRVHLLALEDDLGRDMSRYLADRIERTPNVEVHLQTRVTELIGEGTLQGIAIEDLAGQRREELEARSLFVFIGASPHTGWLGDLIDLDAEGFVETDGNPLLLETNQPGVFAAGDVRHGSIKRVASAVGEGAMAVRFVHEHLDGRHRDPQLQTNVSSK